MVTSRYLLLRLVSINFPSTSIITLLRRALTGKSSIDGKFFPNLVWLCEHVVRRLTVAGDLLVGTAINSDGEGDSITYVFSGVEPIGCGMRCERYLP